MNKLTKLEIDWVLYDVGNSAFVLLLSTIIPIYFKNLAAASGVSGADSTAYLGYALSLSTLVVVFLGPILGSFGDEKNHRKPLFLTMVIIGVAGLIAMAFNFGWVVFLIFLMIARIAYSISIIFYDSMIVDVTTDERADQVSSHGFAWGYIGSTIPFIISLALILQGDKIGISTDIAMLIAFILNAVWWLVFTVPLLKNYEQTHFVDKGKKSVSKTINNIKTTLKEIRQDSKVFLFLVSFFFYIDGVYTIIEMATSYGKDVGIDDTTLLVALLVTQIVAFPFALIFGRLAKRFKATSIIFVSILGYLGIAMFAVTLDSAWKFWVLAILVAVFQGAIQALSRSHFSSIIPAEKSSEYFSIYDIFGKGASFTGTLLVGVIAQITNNTRFSIIGICFLFVIGAYLFRKSIKHLDTLD